jgi:hypothetical protein
MVRPFIAIALNCQAQFYFQMPFIFYGSVGIRFEARLIFNQMTCQIFPISGLPLKSIC